MLDNKELKAIVESLRKEKAGANNILESVIKKVQETERKREKIHNENKFALKHENGKICKEGRIDYLIIFFYLNSNEVWRIKICQRSWRS